MQANSFFFYNNRIKVFCELHVFKPHDCCVYGDDSIATLFSAVLKNDRLTFAPESCSSFMNLFSRVFTCSDFSFNSLCATPAPVNMWEITNNHVLYLILLI